MGLDSVYIPFPVKNLYNVNNNMCKGKRVLNAPTQHKGLSRVHYRVYRNTTDRMCK